MLVYKNGKIRENYRAFRRSGDLVAAILLVVYGVLSGFFSFEILSLIPYYAPFYTLIIVVIPLGLISIKCFKMAYGEYSRSLMKYEIGKEGFILQFPHEAQKIIPWYMFQDTCICYIAYTNRSYVRGAVVGIVLALPSAKKDRFGRWSAKDPSRYRDAIMFDYTEELHKEFIEKCPRKLIDRRMEKEYML